MNRFIKILLISIIFSIGTYLLLEIYKLRNKIKLLELQLHTEDFTHTKTSTIVKEVEVDSEILQYERELEEVDNLINNLHSKSIQKKDNAVKDDSIDDQSSDGQVIEVDEEDIDLTTIENEVSQLSNGDDTLTDIDDNSTEHLDGTGLTELNSQEESLITFYNQKYNKKHLQQLCTSHSQIKTGTKKDIILRLLNIKALDRDVSTTSIELNTGDVTVHTQTETETDTGLDKGETKGQIKEPIIEQIGEQTEHMNTDITSTDNNGGSDDEDSGDTSEVSFALDIDDNLQLSSVLHKLKIYNEQANSDDQTRSLHM